MSWDAKPLHGMIVVGVDGGPTPGVGVIIADYMGIGECSIFQCNADSLMSLVFWQLGRMPGYHRVLATERFVVNARSGRSSSARAGETVRKQVGALEEMAKASNTVFRQRSASEVKLWASEVRLVRAGFKLPSGMPHGKDGARHALFAAVADAGLPDPLSRKQAGAK